VSMGDAQRWIPRKSSLSIRRRWLALVVVSHATSLDDMS
jgi:hypothetical protein